MTFQNKLERVLRYQYYPAPFIFRTAGDRPQCKFAIAGPLLRSKGEGDVVVSRFWHANENSFKLALEIQWERGIGLCSFGVASLCFVVVRHRDFKLVFSVWVNRHLHLRNANGADPFCVGRGRRRRSCCLRGWDRCRFYRGCRVGGRV